MDWKNILDKIKRIEKKNLLLIALAGMILIVTSYFDMGDKKDKVEEMSTACETNETSYQSKLEQKIKKLIGGISGISNVNVMITLKSGYEKVLKEDVDNSSSSSKKDVQQENSISSKKSTVIFNQNGDDVPYIIKEVYPEVEGIAVVAKGVSRKNNREEIINMLSALFDVPVHKISVLEND